MKNPAMQFMVVAVLLGSMIGFAGLYLAGTAALGSLPKATDSGQSVRAWFADNGGHVHLALLFITFGLVLYAVYAAIIRSALPSPFGDVFLVDADCQTPIISQTFDDAVLATSATKIV